MASTQQSRYRVYAPCTHRPIPIVHLSMPLRVDYNIAVTNRDSNLVIHAILVFNIVNNHRNGINPHIKHITLDILC